VTSAAVALSFDFAAAMSSGEGMSGEAGRWTDCACDIDNDLDNDGGAAWAGKGDVPKSTTAVHSTAAFRPIRVKPIRRTSQRRKAGGARPGVWRKTPPLLIAQQSEAT